MYRWLLCWRYLRTRFIALASIISVTLGVATMIVVNSVMMGFTHEMENRLHGILSDIIFQSRSLEGFPDADWHMDQIRRVAGDAIEGMTPTVVVPGMLNYQLGDTWMTRPVQVIGIDEKTQAKVSDFAKYLQHPENRRQLSFNLREGGYDVIDHQADGPALPRTEMSLAGWEHRRRVARMKKMLAEVEQLEKSQNQAEETPPDLMNPFERAAPAAPALQFDPETSQYTGVILGIGLVSFRRDGQDHFVLLPGDDVKLTLPTVGTPPKIVSDTFTIVDIYESKMSEYDSNFAFVPIRALQQLRGMVDPTTGKGYVNAISIKLKPGANMNEVRDRLRAAFAPQYYAIDTWRDNQGPLLAAVSMETAILNVLLFLIICVAGFGILAIFFMIVVEKTRDIGILKALGASSGGVMSIFLGYGLLLGMVGAGAGLTLGLIFVHYINEIADLLGQITGHRVFDPDIYYFYKIPTIVDPFTVGWIISGAMLIAILASVLPALRAARLHPVEALRYE